jgi:hypothetical protein
LESTRASIVVSFSIAFDLGALNCNTQKKKKPGHSLAAAFDFCAQRSQRRLQ